MTVDFVSSLKLLKCQLYAMLIDDIIVSSRSIVLNWLNNLELYVIYANHDIIFINNIIPIDSAHDDRLVGYTPSSIDTITVKSGCGGISAIDGRTTWNCSVLVDTIMCEASSFASEVEMKPSSTMKPSLLSSLSTNIVLFSINLLGHLLSISQQLLLHSDNTSIDDTHHQYQHSGDDIEYATTAAAGEGGDQLLHKVISIVYHALEHPDARVREQISVIIRILYSSRSFNLNLNNPNTELLFLSNLNSPNTEFLSNLNNPNTTEFLSNLHDYIVAHIQSHWCRSVSMRETSLGDESEIAMDDTTGDDDSDDDHHHYHHLCQQSNLVIFITIVIHPPIFAFIYPTSSIHNLSMSSDSCLSTPLSSPSPSLSSIGWHYLESYLKALYSLLLGLLPIEHCMPYLLYHTIDMPRDMSSSMLSHALPEYSSMMMMMMMLSRLTTTAEHDSNQNKDNKAINTNNNDDDDDEIIVASNSNTLQLRSSELLIYCTSLHVNRHVREGMLSALYHYHP